MTSEGYAVNGFIKIAFKDYFELVARRVVKLYVECRQESVKDARGIMVHSLVGAKGSSRLTIMSPSPAIVATFRYLLTSLIFVSFLDGRVP